jgi:hypothetical protein
VKNLRFSTRIKSTGFYPAFPTGYILSPWASEPVWIETSGTYPPVLKNIRRYDIIEKARFRQALLVIFSSIKILENETGIRAIHNRRWFGKELLPLLQAK